MAKNRINHLLVIRLSAMGDVAMTVPVLVALTEKYPDLKITYLTKPFFSPIVSGIPKVRVFKADVKGVHKGIIGLWRLFKQLKGLEIDAVADLHNVIRSNVLSLFFKLNGTPVKQVDKGRKEKKALTSGKLKELKPLKPMYLRYKSVLHEFGFDYPLADSHVLKKLPFSAKHSANFLPANTLTIGIAPFAAFQGKVYPLDAMKVLLLKLSKLSGVNILLFGGGQKEKETMEDWERNFSNCHSIVGKMGFKDELSLISNLDLMIAMDSGNGHLAAMYGVPVITLWGITHPSAGFTPFGQTEEQQITSDRDKYPLIPTSVYGNKMPQGYENVMESIDPEKVYNKVLDILDHDILRLQ